MIEEEKEYLCEESKGYPPPMGEAPSSTMGKPTTKMLFEIELVPYSWPRRYNLVESISKQIIFDSLDKKNAIAYIKLYEKLYKGVPRVVVNTSFL